MSNTASETTTIEQLRRAAAATLAIPGLGLRLHQTNRPTLRVTHHRAPPAGSATSLSPNGLRAITIALAQGCRDGARQIVDPSRGMAMEWFSSDDVALGPFDVFEVTLAPEAGAFVFAATDITTTRDALRPLLAAHGSTAPWRRATASPAGIPVELHHDEGLDVALVYAYYDPSDHQTRTVAATASFDLLACSGAARAAMHNSTTGDGR